MVNATRHILAPISRPFRCGIFLAIILASNSLLGYSCSRSNRDTPVDEYRALLAKRSSSDLQYATQKKTWDRSCTLITESAAVREHIKSTFWEVDYWQQVDIVRQISAIAPSVTFPEFTTIIALERTQSELSGYALSAISAWRYYTFPDKRIKLLSYMEKERPAPLLALEAWAVYSDLYDLTEDDIQLALRLLQPGHHDVFRLKLAAMLLASDVEMKTDVPEETLAELLVPLALSKSHDVVDVLNTLAAEHRKPSDQLLEVVAKVRDRSSGEVRDAAVRYLTATSK